MIVRSFCPPWDEVNFLRQSSSAATCVRGVNGVGLKPKRSPFISHRYQRPSWLGRQLDTDRVVGPHGASSQNDAHDAGLANQPALLVTPERCLHQTRLKIVHLITKIGSS